MVLLLKPSARLLGRFQKSEILSVKGKYITILNHAELMELAGVSKESK
ncbi:ggdef family protein [Vibrio cholerae CT 5369-93]|nr:ggdef family protein [Vibrio cholerae CT 5369-93]